MLATWIPYPRSVELARAALALLRAQPEVDADRIVLVGHSLGAMRARHIADDGVHAMVFLDGAYLGKVRGSAVGTANTYPAGAMDPAVVVSIGAWIDARCPPSTPARPAANGPSPASEP